MLLSPIIEKRNDYMIAALYIRVSTDDQLEFSPDAQKRALIEYAKKNGYQIDDRYIFIDEGISGTSASKRPEFMKMIATSKKKPKPFDAILVHKFDRFARSREDSVVYKSLLRKECGIKVISITEQIEDDKFSVILEAMLEAMAEYYSLNLSDEVMKGMTEKARRGGVQTRAILGYDIIDNKYVINEDESKLVNRIYEMIISGMSCPQVAKKLNALGCRNKNGSVFSSKRIKYIATNQVYIGTLIWNKRKTVGTRQILNDEKDWIIVENAHQGIVERSVWDETQKALAKWHKDVNTSWNSNHIFTGVFRCSACGSTLSYKMARFKKKDGTITNSDGYQCCKFRNSACDTSNFILANKAFDHVINILSKTLDIVNDTWSLENINIEDTRKNDDIILYKVQIDKLNHKLELAKKAYMNEIDTLEEYKENKMNIQNEIESIKKAIDCNTINDDETVNEFKGRLITLIDALNSTQLSVSQKNNYLKGLIKSIVYNKKEDKMIVHFYI